MSAVTLDWAGALPELAKTAAGYNLTATVVTERGPGGGWPVVRFEGAPRDIESLVIDYTASDPVETAYILGEVIS